MKLDATMQIHCARKLQGRINYQGLPVSIENRKGSVRTGTDHNGKPWSQKMTVPYGYIRLTEGTDGDHLDCFVGNARDSDRVFVIHTNNVATGEYDEDKVMLGFKTSAQAKQAFLENYNNEARHYRSMTTMTFAEFKEKLADRSQKGQMVATVGVGGAFHHMGIEPLTRFRAPGMMGKPRNMRDDPPYPTQPASLKKEGKYKESRLKKNPKGAPINRVNPPQPLATDGQLYRST